jgi:hypothetical protein
MVRMIMAARHIPGVIFVPMRAMVVIPAFRHLGHPNSPSEPVCVIAARPF